MDSGLLDDSIDFKLLYDTSIITKFEIDDYIDDNLLDYSMDWVTGVTISLRTTLLINFIIDKKK